MVTKFDINQEVRLNQNKNWPVWWNGKKGSINRILIDATGIRYCVEFNNDSMIFEEASLEAIALTEVSKDGNSRET